VSLVFAGCVGCQQPGGDDGGSGGGAGGGGGGSGEEFAASAKGQVRFKRNIRLTIDYAQALGLQVTEVCNELGQYNCTALVHALSLGGVDPYGSGLYEPIPFSGSTSPIAIDRVALAACTTRVARDMANPAFGTIYKFALDGSGKISNIEGADVDLALTTLYERTLLRDPTDDEKKALKGLYADIVASGKPEPGKNWMILSCFAVTSSVEFLFY
jgi:hypothetical protein